MLYTLHKDLNNDVKLVFNLGLDFVDLCLGLDFVDATSLDFIVLQQRQNNIFSEVSPNTPNHLVNPTKTTLAVTQLPFLVLMIYQLLTVLTSCSRAFKIS